MTAPSGERRQCPVCSSFDLAGWVEDSSGGEATGVSCDDCGFVWGDGFPEPVRGHPCACGRLEQRFQPCFACRWNASVDRVTCSGCGHECFLDGREWRDENGNQICPRVGFPSHKPMTASAPNGGTGQ